MHIPVMIEEVCSFIQGTEKTIIDATFGGGGYTKAILEKCKKTNIVAIDRDSAAIERAKIFSDTYPNQFHFIHDSFSSVNKHLAANSTNILIADLGVSSFQLDEGARGFSFQNNGPLDMRMNMQDSLTAREIVNSYSETDLADIIYHYGDERHSRRIAKAIVESRRKKTIESTLDLATIILNIIPKTGPTNPCTRTFQALRIYVNNELIEIGELIKSAADVLVPNGLLIVITFHSLEERVVKQSCKKTIEVNSQNISWKPFIKRPLEPSRQEICYNKRARSAKLRVYQKKVV